MNREEITSSQEYKAEKIAIDWWRNYVDDIRSGEKDPTDAFAEGVIYGWNNPNWISVEEMLPEVGEKVIFYSPGIDDWLSGALQQDGRWWCEEYGTHFYDVTHWMEIVPPRKEE